MEFSGPDAADFANVRALNHAFLARLRSPGDGRHLREQLPSALGALLEALTNLQVERLAATSGRDFGFIQQEKGMFSFLGLSAEQAIRLREEYSVYMLDSSRINVAGINARNIDYLADAVAAVL